MLQPVLQRFRDRMPGSGLAAGTGSQPCRHTASPPRRGLGSRHRQARPAPHLGHVGPPRALDPGVLAQAVAQLEQHGVDRRADLAAAARLHQHLAPQVVREADVQQLAGRGGRCMRLRCAGGVTGASMAQLARGRTNPNASAAARRMARPLTRSTAPARRAWVPSLPNSSSACAKHGKAGWVVLQSRAVVAARARRTAGGGGGDGSGKWRTRIWAAYLCGFDADRRPHSLAFFSRHPGSCRRLRGAWAPPWRCQKWAGVPDG